MISCGSPPCWGSAVINPLRDHLRHVPFIRNVKIRTVIGFALLVFSVLSAQVIFRKGQIEVIVPIAVFAWMVAVFDGQICP